MAVIPNGMTTGGGEINEPCDEYACEACGGMGYVKSQEMRREPTFPDCTQCEGTGVMTEAAVEAYRNR